MNIKQLQKICHQIAVEKGFWDDMINYLKQNDNRNNGCMIALMHSELSEALEELRKPDCKMKLVGEELADCVIRILDFCGGRGIDLQTAIEKKIKKNKKRPHKHGKRF